MAEQIDDESGEYLGDDGDGDESETVTFSRPRGRGDAVPDGAVENADDTPLLAHAGTGKKNTVLYIKVIRTDGLAGERGYKGKLQSGATMDDLARRFGNGTYDLMGCNASHKVIAKEIDMEISMPQYDDAASGAAPAGVAQGPGSFAHANLHAMKLISGHAESHADTVREMAASNSEQVTTLAKATVDSIQTFATAQRDADRQAHETTTNTMAQFFAAMQTSQTNAAAMAAASQATAHTQQMEMLTAMNDRARTSEQNPMELVEVLVRGMALGKENAGDGDEPWAVALKEGGNMLGNLAQLASSPGAHAASAQLQAGRHAAARQLVPGAAPPPRPAAPAAPAAPNPEGRKRNRLPFSKGELRAVAALRAELRKREVSLEDFLAQTREHFATAPDSEVFENDGPSQGSDDARDESPASPEPAASVEAGTPDVNDAGGEG